jgi:hypothetical protein
MLSDSTGVDGLIGRTRAAGLRTPDDEWTVAVYRRPRTTKFWYRLRHGDSLAEDLSIAGV